jgi:hypothetical protein
MPLPSRCSGWRSIVLKPSGQTVGLHQARCAGPDHRRSSPQVGFAWPILHRADGVALSGKPSGRASPRVVPPWGQRRRQSWRLASPGREAGHRVASSCGCCAAFALGPASQPNPTESSHAYRAIKRQQWPTPARHSQSRASSRCAGKPGRTGNGAEAAI